jgi:hypothetical protein
MVAAAMGAFAIVLAIGGSPRIQIRIQIQIRNRIRVRMTALCPAAVALVGVPAPFAAMITRAVVFVVTAAAAATTTVFGSLVFIFIQCNAMKCNPIQSTPKNRRNKKRNEATIICVVRNTTTRQFEGNVSNGSYSDCYFYASYLLLFLDSNERDCDRRFFLCGCPGVMVLLQ